MSEGLFHRALSGVRSRPILTGVAAASVLGIVWTVNDFQDWKAFGTGGTPPTWYGYARMTLIRVIHTLKFENLVDPSSLSREGPKYLKSATLPKRSGGHAKIVSRTMPQRQVPEPIEPATRDRLQGLMRQLALAHPELLEVRPSHTEGKSTDGLYARTDLATLNPIARDRVLNHEIAHAHPADNSLHVWLSDPDARAVIEAGWGQRFPLAIAKSGWIMVYAPRNAIEMDTVEDIVHAGVNWITGVAI